jgi:hypothetical protein
MIRDPGIAHAEPDGVTLTSIDVRLAPVGDGKTLNLLVALG